METTGPVNVMTAILEARDAARRAGLPYRRVYLGRVKILQLEEELAQTVLMGDNPPPPVSSATVFGMKVVESKTPGIRVGI